MLKQLMMIAIGTSLLLAGSVYAEAPDFIVVYAPGNPTGETSGVLY